MKKRILSALLVCVMLVGLVPMMGTKVKATESYLWPCPSSRVINKYYSSGSHYGIDIGAASGAAVVATKSGIVYIRDGCNNINGYYQSCYECGCKNPIEYKWEKVYDQKTNKLLYGNDLWYCNGGMGNVITIKHNDGTFSRYHHLSSITVSQGSSVQQGQTIGYVGSTGISTGAHLHFALGTHQGYDSNINSNPGAISYIYSLIAHNHDLNGGYAFKEAAHPHYSCYYCSVCGSAQRNYNETNIVESCETCRAEFIKPGKPALIGINSSYTEGSSIEFKWAETANTTHYNLYIDHKVEENWERHESVHYAENNLSRSLPVGQYRVAIQSTNSNYWTLDKSSWEYTDGDWMYFEVVASHNYVLTSTTPASCTEDGYITYTCSDCGDTYTDVIPALEHDFVYSTIPATCVESAMIHAVCSRCGYDYYEPLTSEWTDTYPEGVDENQVDVRYAGKTKEYTSSEEDGLDGWTKYDTVQNGWTEWSDWQNTAVSATSTREVETRNIPAVTHTEYNYSRYLDSTYTHSGPTSGTWGGANCNIYQERGWGSQITNVDYSQGFAIYYATSSSAWYNQTTRTVTDSAAYTQYRYRDAKYTYYYYKWSDYSDWTSQPIEANDDTEVKIQYRYTPAPSGHSFGEWTVTAPASCTAEGVETRTCSVCGDSETRAIEMLAHNYVNGKCTACGAIDPDYVIDPNAAKVSVESVSARPGETITLNVNIADNPGVAGAVVWIDFDPDVFDFADPEDPESCIYTDRTGARLSLLTTNVNTPGRIGIVFGQAANTVRNGALVTIELTVAEEAIPGDYEIAVSVTQIKNAAREDVPCVTENGIVSVNNVLYGDADGNGQIDVSDIIVLCQRLLDETLSIGDGADVDGNGTLDISDVILICQFLLDETIVLGPRG